MFWPQAQAANKLYEMLDGKQQEQALVAEGLPTEQRVGFRGKEGKFHGIAGHRAVERPEGAPAEGAAACWSSRTARATATRSPQCLKTQGGLDACQLAFYAQDDIGNDNVWDNWRLEGPSFVWYFRGAPHVHVWVNVADDPSVKLNA